MDQNYAERMTRVEDTISRMVAANATAHERYEAEDKRLLTAQIFVTDALRKISSAVDRMVEVNTETSLGLDRLTLRVDGLAQTTGHLAEVMAAYAAHTDQRFAETTEKLDALIRIVDGMIQGRIQ